MSYLLIASFVSMVFSQPVDVVEVKVVNPTSTTLVGSTVTLRVEWHLINHEDSTFAFILQPPSSAPGAALFTADPLTALKGETTLNSDVKFSNVSPGTYQLQVVQAEPTSSGTSISGQFTQSITIVTAPPASGTTTTTSNHISMTDTTGDDTTSTSIPSTSTTPVLSVSRLTDGTVTVPSQDNTSISSSSTAISSIGTGSNASPNASNYADPGIGGPTSTSNSRTRTPTDSLLTSTLNSETPSALGSNGTKRDDTSAIIGGVIGGLAFLAMVVLALLYLRRRRTKRNSTTEIFDKNKMVKERKSDYPFAAIHSPSYREKSTTEERAAVLKSYSRDTSPSPSAHETAITASDVNEEISRTSRTDRQMEIEERIQQLQAQLISLYDKSRIPRSQGKTSPEEEQMGEIREKIDRLNALKESDWALDLSDERPPDMD
ncbi:hypothetical protein VNI00_010285 [Paramarasmius palmivorus]|uniref:Uncharacterized protein n=1 Tax=Paramarasmius palmivorus TaxID=297713 RepID=A0AAW0CL30_9AGAR